MCKSVKQAFEKVFGVSDPSLTFDDLEMKHDVNGEDIHPDHVVKFLNDKQDKTNKENK